MPTWRSSRRTAATRTGLALLTSALFLGVMTPGASALAHRLPEATCEYTAHVPWATQTPTGNWVIRAMGTTVCTVNVDHIQTAINLDKQKVAAGSQSVWLREKVVNCYDAQYCRADFNYDVKDNPEFVWMWWTTGFSSITDADGSDFDSDSSPIFVWPWE